MKRRDDNNPVANYVKSMMSTIPHVEPSPDKIIEACMIDARSRIKKALRHGLTPERLVRMLIDCGFKEEELMKVFENVQVDEVKAKLDRK